MSLAVQPGGTSFLMSVIFSKWPHIALVVFGVNMQLKLRRHDCWLQNSPLWAKHAQHQKCVCECIEL